MKTHAIYHKISRQTLYQATSNTLLELIELAIEQKIDLSGADFSYLNLSNANFDGLKAQNISFAFANLSGANLSEAHLINCDFENAQMNNCCMCESYFQKCSFTHTHFGATDIALSTLCGCTFQGSSFLSLPFSKLQTLEHCKYISASGVTMHFSSAPIVLFGVFQTPIAWINHQAIMNDNTIPSLPITKFLEVLSHHQSSLPAELI